MRERALRQRQALPADLRAERTRTLVTHLDALVAQLRPTVLGFCWPYRAEPDLRDWVRAWLAQDERHVAALPVVVERHAALVFRSWRPDAPMAVDRHGIPHPEGGEAVIPEVLLIPLNAFDERGYRLGYGGGYFDRTLALLPSVAVGVGFALGRVPDTLPQLHDKPMDWIITELGVLRPRA